MKLPVVASAALLFLMVMASVRGASLPEERPLYREEISSDTTTIGEYHTMLTENSTALSEKTDTILSEGKVCEVVCDSSLGEICSPTLKICTCPMFTFRSMATGHCKAQVAVNVQLKSSEFQDHFADVLKRVYRFVEVSPHLEVEDRLDKATVTIFVEADFFNKSWTNDEKDLRSLFGSAEPNFLRDLSVARDPCDNPKTHPCAVNALCISSTVRYHVECFCRLNYRDLSAGTGRRCVREPHCLNEGLPYLLRGGPDKERFGCHCMSLFAGEHCELNLLRLGITGVVLIAMVAIAIWTHPIHCLSLFHGCHLDSIKTVEINQPSRNTKLTKGASTLSTPNKE